MAKKRAIRKRTVSASPRQSPAAALSPAPRLPASSVPTSSPAPLAFVTVYDKTNVQSFCSSLASRGWRFVSCGGTFTLLQAAGLPVQDVSDVIESTRPDAVRIFGGRLKTLQPCVHGAILASTKEEHRDLETHGITPIDMVVANLAPHGGDVAGLDIGGASLLRCAAKTARVAAVSNPEDYEVVLEDMDRETGHVSPQLRRRLAKSALGYVASYDASVYGGARGLSVSSMASPVPKRAVSLKRYIEHSSTSKGDRAECGSIAPPSLQGVPAVLVKARGKKRAVQSATPSRLAMLRKVIQKMHGTEGY